MYFLRKNAFFSFFQIRFEQLRINLMLFWHNKIGGSSMIGKLIRFMRKRNKFSQRQLADYLQIANCTLSHYEVESRSVSFSDMVRIAEACGFSIKFVDNTTEEVFELNDMVRKDV